MPSRQASVMLRIERPILGRIKELRDMQDEKVALDTFIGDVFDTVLPRRIKVETLKEFLKSDEFKAFSELMLEDFLKKHPEMKEELEEADSED